MVGRLAFPPVTIGGERLDPAAAALAVGLGLIGGFVASVIGAPLPMLLGSVIAVGAAGLFGLRVAGRVPAIPVKLRMGAIPVIGVSIGSAFTPEILSQFAGWWPSLVALLVFIPLAHAVAFTLMRTLGGVEPVTAWYGSAPGGLIEAVILGEEAGGDTALLTMLQFLRLILCIILVPIGFTILTGEAVGSSSGAVIGGKAPLSVADWAILIVAGIVGAVAGRRLKLPAGIITGPIILSGLVHIAGWVEGGPPGWLIAFVQLVVGVTLGVRFVNRSPRLVAQALRGALAAVLAILALAGLAAALLAPLAGERWEAVFLAYAPGGLAEMSLIALSLETSVIFVSAHHVMRIMLAITFAKLGAKVMLRGR